MFVIFDCAIGCGFNSYQEQTCVEHGCLYKKAKGGLYPRGVLAKTQIKLYNNYLKLKSTETIKLQIKDKLNKKIHDNKKIKINYISIKNLYYLPILK